jgi:hypothetical protein
MPLLSYQVNMPVAMTVLPQELQLINFSAIKSLAVTARLISTSVWKLPRDLRKIDVVLILIRDAAMI